MRRIAASLLLLIVALVVPTFAAGGNPVLGKWDCKSVDNNGSQRSWTMVVKQEQGKLSGWVEAVPPEATERMELIEPKLDGNTFTFSVDINPQERVSVNIKLDGDKFEGNFSGKDSGAGTFSGKKQA